ncbi:MAG: hypothetical protein A3C35_02870 [Omnitrophica bacterium RIFCSPHIGHO2_02_FULL_46_11]|nr:MAG: hypothetical protein A3C35_02870 [Omnitrophica bacterium RIFCSPHIGHO2_02_FULL_46_11]OGW84863.1 MAG: hypothetical protein A3A81_00900 [Omnitrophica bacterium RIFCSPLOWO2_01_FULL_45_10b]
MGRSGFINPVIPAPAQQNGGSAGLGGGKAGIQTLDSRLKHAGMTSSRVNSAKDLPVDSSAYGLRMTVLLSDLNESAAG